MRIFQGKKGESFQNKYRKRLFYDLFRIGNETREYSQKNILMRKRFEPQEEIGLMPIADIVINENCRDAFPKLLLALKEIFVNPQYNERIFTILEKKLLQNKKIRDVMVCPFGIFLCSHKSA
jgi:hypothetical protein